MSVLRGTHIKSAYAWVGTETEAHHGESTRGTFPTNSFAPPNGNRVWLTYNMPGANSRVIRCMNAVHRSTNQSNHDICMRASVQIITDFVIHSSYSLTIFFSCVCVSVPIDNPLPKLVPELITTDFGFAERTLAKWWTWPDAKQELIRVWS